MMLTTHFLKVQKKHIAFLKVRLRLGHHHLLVCPMADMSASWELHADHCPRRLPRTRQTLFVEGVQSMQGCSFWYSAF